MSIVMLDTEADFDREHASKVLGVDIQPLPFVALDWSPFLLGALITFLERKTDDQERKYNAIKGLIEIRLMFAEVEAAVKCL